MKVTKAQSKLQLSQNLKGVEAKEGPSGKKFPECKGYKMVIKTAVDAPSKAGNKMLTIGVDIADGPFANFFEEYPLRQWLVYGLDSQIGRFKGTLQAIINENKNMFPSDVLDTDNFDESKLVGLICGGILKWGDRGYLELDHITSLEKAEKAPTIERPSQVSTGGESGKGFHF